MTTYYLSGPMRGKPDHNREMFTEVEEALNLHILNDSTDDSVINPSRNFGGRVDLPVSDYMALDLQQVLAADVVVQLPGWQQSEGACREAQLGVWAGKRFTLAERDYYGDDQPCTWDFRQVDGPEFSESPRGGMLDEAKQLVTGSRNNAYGPPTADFSRTAAMANGFGFRVTAYEGAKPEPLQAHHIAIFMILLKMSRLAWTSTKRDSWVDAAGYAACGLECSLVDENARLDREVA